MVQTEKRVTKEVKSGYPTKWVHILNAPLSEGSISIYLGALEISLDHRHIPSPMIIQSLVYFTLVPPTLPAGHQPPINLLFKILNHHTIELHQSECLPVYPHNRDSPRWSEWEANSPTERLIKKYMSKASKEGIWGLLWDTDDTGTEMASEGVRRSKRRKRGEEVDEEDEEGGKGEKTISENGWVLLKWLVAYWKKDQVESGLGYSPAFLAQMPRQRDMQSDNPSLPLAVIQSALSHPNPSHIEVASDIMALLIQTATPPCPPFHPATLLLSLLPLFRNPLSDLRQILQLFKNVPKGVYTHFLIHAIEDLAGIRASKAAERRRRPNQNQNQNQPDPDPTLVGDFTLMSNHEGEGSSSSSSSSSSFPAPTVGYTTKVLLYTVKSDSKAIPPAVAESDSDSESESDSGPGSGSGSGSGSGPTPMTLLKLALVTTMVQLYPTDEQWTLTQKGCEWRTQFDELPADEVGQCWKEMILTILDLNVDWAVVLGGAPASAPDTAPDTS